jgi:hypothetical protein
MIFNINKNIPKFTIDLIYLENTLCCKNAGTIKQIGLIKGDNKIGLIKVDNK